MTRYRTHVESSHLSSYRTLDLPGLAASLIIVASLGYLFEFAGVAVGVVTTITWFALGTPYAIAVGHVLLATLVRPSLTVESLAIMEVGFVALVLAPLLRAPAPQRFLLATVVTIAIVAVITVLALDTHSLTLAAVLSLGTIATLCYAVHRLTLVRLGKVDSGGAP